MIQFIYLITTYIKEIYWPAVEVQYMPSDQEDPWNGPFKTHINKDLKIKKKAKLHHRAKTFKKWKFIDYQKNNASLPAIEPSGTMTLS